MTNRDRPLRTGFGIIPNRLWTLPDLTPNQRCLLGWLHSHADDYTARLSISRIGREYGGGKRARDHLAALEDDGWLLIVHGEPGEKARVVLLSEPWESLLDPPRNVTPPSHETGEVPPTECDTPLPQNVTAEKNNLEAQLSTAVEHLRDRSNIDPASTPAGMFQEFWSRYPRRVAKADAWKAWSKMTGEQRVAATDTIDAHVALWRAEGRGTRTVPYPATWLRRESWCDELAYLPERQAGAGSIMDRITSATRQSV